MYLRRTAALAVTVSALALIPMTPAGARPAFGGLTTFDRQLIADLNSTRLERGIQALDISDGLTPIATKWAQHIAAAQNASDNPHLRSALNAACPTWRKVGENVGIGTSADDLFDDYMRNPGERRTMLSTKFTSVGVHSVATHDASGLEEWNVIDFASHCA
ncbi:MAG TPA: CAP domain-containing protein [Mycobacteriales bacterium]|jgi:uncharacterized protein YkwD|nr:CAP domain-containing protein [Mycobacteriales bacterium]